MDNKPTCSFKIDHTVAVKQWTIDVLRCMYGCVGYLYRVSQKKSPLTKYDTIAPNLEINEIRFRVIDPDVHAVQKWY